MPSGCNTENILRLYNEELLLNNRALPPRKAPAVFSDVIERAGERVLPARSLLRGLLLAQCNVDSLIVEYLNSPPNYSTRGKYLVWVKVLNI